LVGHYMSLSYSFSSSGSTLFKPGGGSTSGR
jgi:hypothetical protein